jgi:hypothetical protein
MARGWESKSVEDQIDAASAAKSLNLKPRLTPEERERQAQRSSLLLARARTVKDLESARNPHHKAILERALAHLDAQLSAIAQSPITESPM